MKNYVQIASDILADHIAKEGGIWWMCYRGKAIRVTPVRSGTSMLGNKMVEVRVLDGILFKHKVEGELVWQKTPYTVVAPEKLTKQP